MSLAQLLLLRQGGASGTLPLEETCCEEEGSAMFALAGLVPGQALQKTKALEDPMGLLKGDGHKKKNHFSMFLSVIC